MIDCDFCGCSDGLRCYPTEISSVEWHACKFCITAIRNEDWGTLIERIVGAFAALQSIPESEQDVFRCELANAFGKQLKTEANVPHPRTVTYSL